MLPEWSWPYVEENYTGPYLSDGKLQSSVANGKAPPKSKLDQLSRSHDTAYALAKSDLDRRRADKAYYAATRRMSWFPRLAGDIVLYGNDPQLFFSDATSWAAGLGANMGNGNGRERAERLRRESREVGPSELLRRINAAGPSTSKDPAMPTALRSATYQPNGTFTEQPQTRVYTGAPDAQSSSEYLGGGGVSFGGRRRRKRRPPRLM